MSSVTRHSLIKCKTKQCPFTPEEHEEWMDLCSRAPEHGHRHDQLTHQHHPKKGMGGNNPLSKIVAILCWSMHDRIDNFDWGNNVTETYIDGQKVTMYRAWDLHNNTLIERPVLSAAAESGHGSDGTQRTRLTMKKPVGQSLGPTEGSAAAPSAGVLSDGAEEGNAPPQGADVELSASAPSLNTKEESDGTESGTDRGGAAHVCERVESSGKKAALDRRPVLGGVSTGVGRSDTVLALTHDQRVAIAQIIRDAQQRRQFLAGDTANLWEEELGEDFWNRYANEFGYTYPSLRNVMRVCKSIPPDQRHNEMSFAHHEAVKTFDIETREAWLERSFDEEWPVKRLREELVAEGLLTTKPRVKRWNMDDLETSWLEWSAVTDDVNASNTVSEFLKWLGEQA